MQLRINEATTRPPWPRSGPRTPSSKIETTSVDDRSLAQRAPRASNLTLSELQMRPTVMRTSSSRGHPLCRRGVCRKCFGCRRTSGKVSPWPRGMRSSEQAGAMPPQARRRPPLTLDRRALWARGDARIRRPPTTASGLPLDIAREA